MIHHRFKANRPKVIGNTNITPYWKVLENIINESDIVLETLDSRMPELSRNKEIEEIVKSKNKKLILILNKSDLVNKKITNKEKNLLKKEFPCYVISSKRKETLKKLREFIFMQARENEFLKIGVVGYPNTGKSSLINSLIRRKKAPISSRAGTTHGQQWINFKDKIKIIDSPGVIPLKENDEIRLALIGSKNPEKIHNIELVAYTIINLFKNSDNLEKFYNLDIKNKNFEEIFENIGRKKGYLKKGNKIDETRIAINLVRDWQSGKLRL